jgi:8-oxo-dGTP pyrophosphatase MutT (NUDIX family)
MQPVATTSPNGGLPAGAKRADDMEPQEWRGLVGGLLEFFAEEAAEPEHAADAGPKTLYVNRPLKNAAALVEWARAAGFKETLAPDDMHVTIAYSREPLAWPPAQEGDQSTPAGRKRTLERLGDAGAIVLRFEDPALAARWQELRDAGASYDYPEYKPHVTFAISDEPDAIDLASIEPYVGPLEFGPEEFAELPKGDWAAKAKAGMVGDAAPTAAGIMYRDPLGNVLLLKRSDAGDHPGEWAFPGGSIEPGETPAEAASRESIEETGHQPDGDMPLLDKSASKGVFHTFVNHVQDQFEPELNEEHDEHVWAHPDRPPEPLHPGVANMFAVVGKGPLAGDDGESFGRMYQKSGDGMMRAKSYHAVIDPRQAMDGVEVDATHDGPWMSCMSADGARMYRNKNVPETADIAGKTVPVDPILLAHEVPERRDLERILRVFKEQNGREPNDAEREVIYNGAHIRSGIPGERAHLDANGIDRDAWNAWCRGIEAKVERGPFENEPDDADVKPIKHTHNELGASDAVLTIALDRDSVREMDRDGRMKVEVTHLSKACVNPYIGKEIPGWQELGLDPSRIYKLLRDPEELRRAAPTFNGIQLLKEHKPVSARDHQMYDIVGTTGSEAAFDEPYLDNSLFVWTQEGIDLIESERQQELSCGYHYKPDMTPGTYEGEAYDGVMRDIVGNHVALVKAGRAGPEVMVGDSAAEVGWSMLERALEFVA